jgi:hypothetical protein
MPKSSSHHFLRGVLSPKNKTGRYASEEENGEDMALIQL